ncbi:MAG: Stp1/IreP family PP2C-type Ser/Thr phosphatase [Deltaproteobacteria bacterium]|nr:Stp1/IreP family PP2C-type Ser/Thr phosphatase [Deltaproteobacteria bacterium]
MHIQSYGTSDKGMLRDHNEDNYLINEEEQLFLVADGMGGLSKGDVASRIAIDTIGHFIVQSRTEDITWPIKPQADYSMEENRLLAGISLANWNIFTEFQKDERHRSMGTTLVGLLVEGDFKVVIANVGDSRIYRIRDNEIQQITDDHSLVMEEVRRGNLTREEARHHPQKHVINRALGISDSTKVDISSLQVKTEDLFLLCSDGLSDMLSDETMLSIVQSNRATSLKAAGDRLIEEANGAGGKDNSTVVLVSFHD